MLNLALKKFIKKPWVKACLIFIVTVIIFGIKYGRQTTLLTIIYSTMGEQKSFLHIMPELRNLSPKHTNNPMVFNAFGYKMLIPWNKSPQYIDNEMAKIAYFLHEGMILIRKPEEAPLNMYQSFKESKEADDIAHFNLVFANKFQNNFDFVKSSFYSEPNLFAVFKPIEEVTLLYYQLTTKWLHFNTGMRIPKEIYHFETENCRGFQIGDPSLSESVTLWLWPDSDTEIEILIQGIGSGKVRQDDIDLIITTFQKSA